MAHRKRETSQQLLKRAGRLPTRVHLGRGYVVQVVFQTPSEMKRDAFPDHDDYTIQGYWSGIDDMKIYIDSTASRKRQWQIYFHELIHAAHDIAEMNRGGI